RSAPSRCPAGAARRALHPPRPRPARRSRTGRRSAQAWRGSGVSWAHPGLPSARDHGRDRAHVTELWRVLLSTPPEQAVVCCLTDRVPLTVLLAERSGHVSPAVGEGRRPGAEPDLNLPDEDLLQRGHLLLSQLQG